MKWEHVNVYDDPFLINARLYSNPFNTNGSANTSQMGEACGVRAALEIVDWLSDGCKRGEGRG
jgi:hypothetical protein